eukprot:395018-Prorocentrum_minimum.AAC.1
MLCSAVLCCALLCSAVLCCALPTALWVFLRGCRRRVDVFLRCYCAEWAAHGWLKENPMGVPTEREVYVLGDNLPVYRVMLVRQ